RLTTILTTLVLGVVAVASSAFAATTNQSTPANGLKVSPVRTELSISPGSSKTVTIYVTDPTTSPIQLQVFIDDFKASGNNGSPQLILNSSRTDPHGLYRYIAPIKNVSLAANQQVGVPVVITIPKGTPAGGYYAAVRFSPVSSGSGQNLTLTANVASLLLVKVPGHGLNEQLNVSSFKVSQNNHPGKYFFSRNSLSAVVQFTNTGNVQEEPFGKVVVQSGGKTILSEEINNSVSPGSVLPGSSRQFSVPLSHFGWFGKYKVSGYFGYGSSGKLLSVSTTIYIIESWVIILILGVIVVIILAIWALTRMHHKHSGSSNVNGAKEI
ncbi:MAG: hypothetical protein ACREF7_02130, partial [Candidatus Saccharimonadales bacterium]